MVTVGNLPSDPYDGSNGMFSISFAEDGFNSITDTERNLLSYNYGLGCMTHFSIARFRARRKIIAFDYDDLDVELFQ